MYLAASDSGRALNTALLTSRSFLSFSTWNQVKHRVLKLLTTVQTMYTVQRLPIECEAA